MFFNEVWKRDKGICQKCGKKVYVSRIIDRYKDTLKRLKNNKVKVYKIHWDCWKCKKKTPIVTYHNIGDIEKLDKLLMKHNEFVKKIYSKTRKKEVIANTCIHCGALQGNWFVWEYFLLRFANCTSEDRKLYESLVDKEIYIELTPEDLGITRENSEPYEEVINKSGHIHHKDGNRDNNNLKNLILLCPSCHRKTHVEMNKKNM